ncbi:Cleavage and polyadenylation specificity factor, partial [Spraguea lophii 42_110]
CRIYIIIITDYNRMIIYEYISNMLVKRYNTFVCDGYNYISIANGIIFIKGYKCKIVMLVGSGRYMEMEMIQNVEDIKYYNGKYYIILKNSVLVKDKIEVEDLYEIKRDGKYLVEYNGYYVVGTYGEYKSSADVENNISRSNADNMLLLNNEEEDFLPEYSFYLEIYTLEFVFVSEFKFLDFEVICDIKKMMLSNKMETKEYIVVCTSLSKGEDRYTRGRILIFDLVDIVQYDQEDVKEESKNNKMSKSRLNHNKRNTKKLKLISEEITKGAVTCCSELRGKICLSIGTKIMVYELDVDGLNGIAFHDLSIFTSSVSTIKNYIIASDIIRGITFFYYQTKPVKLHPLSSSEYLNNIIFTEYMVDEPKLALAGISYNGDIIFYEYLPFNLRSNEGSILMKKVEIKSGVHNLRRADQPMRILKNKKDNREDKQSNDEQDNREDIKSKDEQDNREDIKSKDENDNRDNKTKEITDKYIKTPIFYNKDFIIEILPSHASMLLLQKTYSIYRSKSGINIKQYNFIIRNILIDFINENNIIQEYICN